MTPAETIKIWTNHLQATLYKGISEQEVGKLMAPVARDDAWIYHGGSGRRSRLYVIDDDVQARFDFDHQDVLVAYTVYPSRKALLKGPDGILLGGSETPDAELLFP